MSAVELRLASSQRCKPFSLCRSARSTNASHSCSRSASTCSKTIIFTDRAKSSSAEPAADTDSSATIVSPDGESRPTGFFARSHLTLETLFYLATLGGAQLCRMEDRIGSFKVGKEFDALLVQTGQQSSNSPASTGESDEGLEMLALEEEVDNVMPDLEKGFNPSLIVEPEESIEKEFEKFLFAVSFDYTSDCLRFISISKLTYVASSIGR